jgi:hypothetical protein
VDILWRIEDCEGGVVLYSDNYGICDFTYETKSVSLCSQYYHMNLRERCKVPRLVNRYLPESSVLAMMRPSTALHIRV